jgi:hypothetical protein
MVEKVFRALLAGGFWLAIAGAVACGGDDGICPKVGGVYEPLYVARSGTCGPLNDANYVPIENDIQIQKFANVDVETETIVMGCSIKMTQIVRDKMGVPQKRIDGSALDVQSSNKVEGMITLTRYDTVGNPVCWGEYDAMLQRNTDTLGGATSGR